MNEKLKDMTQKLKKDKKLLCIIALGLCGMLLLLFSSENVVQEKDDGLQKENMTDIQKSMTSQLEGLLKNIDGVGKVKVLITLESLSENVFAENKEEVSDEDSHKLTENYVIIEKNGDSDGLIIKQIMPLVRGVAVCCEGGGSALVRQEVTNTVTAAFGIASNRVWVTKMQND